MGMIIALRDSNDQSHFKEIMLELFDKFGIDEVLICSGYYQEELPFIDNKTNKVLISKYKVTLDVNSAQENLIMKLRGIPRITTVGIKGTAGSFWDTSYRNFVSDLRSNLGPDVVNAYADKSGSWHAKEMIMLSGGHAVAGIIGSSNFTKRAYGSFPNQEFNVEADTIIYESSADEDMAYLVSALREDGGEDSFLIVAPYDSRLNHGTEVSLLDKQYQKIMGMLDDKDKFERF